MTEYRFIDTGNRRVPKDGEMYIYLPSGEMHRWQDGNPLNVGAEGEDYAILALATPPPTMTYKRAAELSLQCQDAVNLSGVLASFKQAVHEAIWPEARKNEKGTDYVNKHPIVFLFLYQLMALNGYEPLNLWEEHTNAERAVKAILQVEEIAGLCAEVDAMEEVKNNAKRA